MKAVQEVIIFFKVKLISAMKLSKTPNGMLVNFNVNNERSLLVF